MSARAVALLLCVSCASPPADAPVARAVVAPANGAARPTTTATEPSLRIASYNIKHGRGADGQVDLERIAKVLAELDADVVLLQEVDRGCARSGHVDQAAYLGDRLGYRAIFCPFRPFDDGDYGMAALTRLPTVSGDCFDMPKGPNDLRALEVGVEHGGEIVRVVGLHLVKTGNQRLRQARYLVERYGDATEPTVLVGDLNSVPTDLVMAQLGRSFDLLGDDSATYPADVPRKRIDYVMGAPVGAWRVTEFRVVDERVASDHRPIVCGLER